VTQSQVKIRVVPPKRVKRALTVNVSPLTADDWEVLELHPDELEAQILNQVQIVSIGVVVPIWTSNGACIRIHIDEVDPVPTSKTPCARLDNMTEVIVAPRVRRKPGDDSADDTVVKKWAFQNLRVLPCPASHGADVNISTNFADQMVAIVSSETMEKYGWHCGKCHPNANRSFFQV
jgi:hypothetical protein